MTTLATHRAGQATRAPRLSGRHRPGDNQPVNGRLLIAAKHRVPADYRPSDRITGVATVPAADTTALILPPDINLAEVTR